MSLDETHRDHRQPTSDDSDKHPSKSTDGPRLLMLEGLVTGYGNKQVLNRVDVEMSAGEVVAVLGHNGAGKSTLLKAIFGLLPLWDGKVCLDGTVLATLNPPDLIALGVAYAPQGNRVFSDLTVGENLEMGGVTLGTSAQLNEAMERVLTLFPALRQRLRQRAGTLSGGEKQMLAIASTLIVAPRLLLLDEPSLGLAPRLVTEALERVQQIAQDSGVACLIVEQKVRDVLKIAQRVYVLRNGVVTFSGPTSELSDDTKLRKVYL